MSPTRLRGLDGIVFDVVSHHIACTPLEEFPRVLVKIQLLLNTYGWFLGVMAFSKTMLRGVSLSIGVCIGLAFWSLASMTMAKTSSGEAATEQMARAQAIRLAPKGATITSVDCEEKDVGFSSRFRCTAHWSQ